VLSVLNGVNHSAASKPKICHPFGWPHMLNKLVK
jgi:hypothetical protein